MTKSRHLPLWAIVGVAAAFAPASGQEGGQYRGPIIDMHMHANVPILNAQGEPLPRPCPLGLECRIELGVAASGEDALQLTLEAMDRHNIVLGFLSQQDGQPLEQLYSWIDAAPHRFVPSPKIDDPANIDLDRLRSDYEAGRLRGLGEISAIYRGIAATDPILRPFFTLAEEFDVPVLIHQQGTAGPSSDFRIALGHPEVIEEVLVDRPALRIYLENAGFPFLDETIALLYRYPNLYVDVSTATWLYPRSAFYRYLRDLLEAGLGKRIMFGSDQMQWPEVIDEAVASIQLAPFLTIDHKADIFYNNAARFLRLSDEEIATHHAR